jgi:hypothetical protein
LVNDFSDDLEFIDGIFGSFAHQAREMGHVFTRFAKVTICLTQFAVAIFMCHAVFRSRLIDVSAKTEGSVKKISECMLMSEVFYIFNRIDNNC